MFLWVAFPKMSWFRLLSVLTGLFGAPLVWDHRAPGIYKNMTGTYITLVMSEKTAAVIPAPLPHDFRLAVKNKFIR
jgi:hypothetical protein